jgi:serine/threonine protein kinase
MESISYDLAGNFSLFGDTYDNKPFFRKYINLEYESDYIEYMISIKLIKNPHPNIVTIYRVTPIYIDMELLLTIDIKDKINFVQVLNAIEHLHNLKIVYIDLKLDNIGISNNNNTKLFDFNCSGILLNNNKWLFKPVNSKNYIILKKTSIKYLKDYDYILFERLLKKYNKKNCWQFIRNIFQVN